MSAERIARQMESDGYRLSDPSDAMIETYSPKETNMPAKDCEGVLGAGSETLMGMEREVEEGAVGD